MADFWSRFNPTYRRKGPAMRYSQNLMGVLLWRTLMAFVLVFLTYNPTQFSLVGYLSNGHELVPVQIAVDALLMIVAATIWWIFLRTAFMSLKWIALAIGLVMLLGVYIIMQSSGYQPGVDGLIYISIVIISILLGIGATASHVKMRWAGVRNVDEVEE
jgi:hypothetical protein